jgi:hypothetical protein
MAKAKSGAPKKKKIPKKSGSKAKTLSKSHAFAKTSREHPHKAKVSQPAKGKAAAEKGKGSARAETSPRAASKETTREMHGITPEQSRPLATKLPALGRPLTKREMEQLLTAGEGRGVVGEGSLKGNLTVKDGFPYLEVVGRDKRELVFLLQGPDQEVLPAYVDHKVSVSGFIRKTTNYGGTVDVRKYSAKKPAPEGHPPEPAGETKLKYLSPGEIEQISASGMGAGMRGFGSLRGDLEMTGEDFFLVVSNAGTRQQVSFLLQGKAARGMRKQVGQTVQVTGVIEKSSGWGGVVQVESFEPRSSERRGFSRESLEVVHVEGASAEGVIETRINQGLTVRLPERAGYIWAIEPTMAKRVGLREANYQPSEAGPGSREFFFTPRNTGVFEIDFFLAKAFSPSQVSKTFKLSLAVKP